MRYKTHWRGNPLIWLRESIVLRRLRYKTHCAAKVLF